MGSDGPQGGLEPGDHDQDVAHAAPVARPVQPHAGLTVLALLGLVLVPLLLLARSLPGHRAHLPLHPASLAPLADEDPERAQRLGRDGNAWCGDALLPFAVDGRRVGLSARADEPLTWAPELGLGSDLTGGSLVTEAHAPNLLHRWLPPGRAQLGIALLHLVLAGLGTLGLLRAQGLGLGACLVGAVAVQAGGFGLLHLHLSMKVGALVPLPWMLWGLERRVRGQRGGTALLTLAGAASLRAGFPPLAAFAWLGTGVVALVHAARGARAGDPAPPSSGRSAARPCGPGGLAVAGVTAGVLALGLAAPALLPMGAEARSSLRGSEPPRVRASEAPPIAALGTLLVPHLLGSPATPWAAAEDPRSLWFLGADEGHLVDAASPLEWNLFAGVLALGLACAGIAGRPRRAVPPLALVGLALGLGFALPGARELLRLPGLGAGAPTRALGLAWPAWAWLAALGVGSLAEGCRRARLAAALPWTLALLVGLLLSSARDETRAAHLAQRLDRALLERFDAPAEELRSRIPEGRGVEAIGALASDAPALLGPSLLGLLGLLVLRRGRAARAWPALALLGLVAEGWGLAGVHLAPRIGDGTGEALELAPDSEGMAALARAAGDARVLRLDTSASGIEDVLQLARPDLPALYGVADLTPYRVFTPRDLVELVAATDPGAPYRSGLSRLSDPRLLGAPLLDLLRVGAVLSREPLHHPRLEPVLERAGFHVYRRVLPAPFDRPAWVVNSSAGDLPLTDLAAGLASGVLDPGRSVVVAGEAGPVGRAPEQPAHWAVEVERSAPDRIELQVPGGPGGWLLIAEAHHPGWRATLDGREVPVRRAMGVLLAVALPPGAHAVHLRYEPLERARGRLLAGASLAALLFLGGIDERRRRRRRDAVGRG